MNNRILYLISAIVLMIVQVTVVCAKSKEKAKRPNIIFIMTDDQSPIVPSKDDGEFNFSDGNGRGTQSHPFGFCGDSDVYTPIIDGLAKEGMVFNRAYVSTSVCSPSRYSILTGRYAGRCTGPSFMKLHPKGEISRVENNCEIEDSKENLAKLLQKAGYFTGFVGKSHIIDHRLLHAKGDKEGLLMQYDKKDNPQTAEMIKATTHNHDYWVKRHKELGFDYANGIYAANLKELKNESLNVHNLEWKNKAALEFIDQAGDEPFFLYYSETVPHGPAPWIKKNGKYSYGLDADINMTSAGYVKQEYENMPSREQIKKEVAEAGKNPDHAWVTWFDHAVGAVVNKLKAKGILENTLIIITSDHGNYNYQKSTLYEGGVKVPLMMYWPKGIKVGSTYDELVQNIDYTPTFLDLAGVDLKKVDKLDGESLVRVLKGNKKPVHDQLFFEIGFARAVMTKDWKYITVRYDEKAQKQIEEGKVFKGWNGHTYTRPYYIRNTHLGYHSVLLNPNYFDVDQLYNIQEDPREKENVFTKFPEKAENMKEVLHKALKSFPGRPYGEFTK